MVKTEITHNDWPQINGTELARSLVYIVFTMLKDKGRTEIQYRPCFYFNAPLVGCFFHLDLEPDVEKDFREELFRILGDPHNGPHAMMHWWRVKV